MNYLLALIVGAWFTQCLYTADSEHREVGISRWAYISICLVASLFWPVLVGIAIRNVMLGRARKPKIPKPSINA